MLDKLIDLLTGIWQDVKPLFVVHQYQTGVMLRAGKLQRVLLPGIHFRIPLLDEPILLTKSWRVAELQAQALVTKDNKPVIAGIIVTYRLHDIETALMEVSDVFVAAQDSAQATFAQHVMQADYDDVRTQAFADRVTKDARAQGFKYGIEISKVRLHELAPARTVRLIGNGEVTHS